MPELHEQRQSVEQVVQDHAAWVFAAAKRRVRDAGLAEDVTQAVFLLYWRKGAGSTPQAKLAGWLHKAMRYCAANALRLKAIRDRHEREAAMEKQRRAAAPVGTQPSWNEVEAEVENAMDRLSDKDRQAVILRFYRGLSLREVAEAAGIGEEAARKRIDRALAKLRERLAARGVPLAAESLGAMILAHAAADAPAGLVQSVSTAINTAGTSASPIAAAAAKTMLAAKVKVAAVALIAIAGVAGVASTTRPADKPPTLTPIVAPPASGNPEMRQLAMQLADQLQAEMRKTRRLGYSYQQWAADLKEDQIAGWTGKGTAVQWAGEYTFDAESGLEYFSNTSMPEDPRKRHTTEIGGGNGRWTELRDDQPGGSRKWAKVVSQRPSELSGTPLTPYSIIRALSLGMGTREFPVDETLRAVQDVEIVKEMLDGQECYRMTMLTRLPVYEADGGQARGYSLGLYRIWLAAGRGLVPVRCEEYDISPDDMRDLPRSTTEWTLPIVLKPQTRMFGLLLQTDLQDAGDGVWVPKCKQAFTFAKKASGERFAMARETVYTNIAVNDKVTPKGAPSIPAEAMKGVLKDMLRNLGK